MHDKVPFLKGFDFKEFKGGCLPCFDSLVVGRNRTGCLNVGVV